MTNTFQYSNNAMMQPARPRGQRSGLPPPDELAGRIEEAKTTAPSFLLASRTFTRVLST